MSGLLLVLISSIFSETGTSIGKYEVQTQKECIYSLGFLGLLWGTVFFIAYSFTTASAFIFDPASLPTFITRSALEIVLAYLIVHAIASADRSTYGFLRIWTLPFLLIADLFLGYMLSSAQVIGICVIAVSFIVLFMNHGIRKEGAWYVITAAILSAVTISLYKYDITHYNSVAAEQSAISIILMTFYFFMARFGFGENPFRLLKNPTILMQSLSAGVADVLLSFAYLLAPASVIASANRSFNVIASLVSGNLYFKEKRLVIKLVSFTLMTVGIILLLF